MTTLLPEIFEEALDIGGHHYDLVHAKVQFAKEDWSAYQGPKGGSGWQNKSTGEVVYGDRPGGEEKQPQERPQERPQEQPPITTGPVKDKRSALSSLAAIGAKTPQAILKAAKMVWMTPDKIEHVVMDYAKTKFARPEVEGPPAPPTKLAQVGKAAWFALRCGTKAAFASWTTAEAAAEKVAIARGATPAEAAAFRHTLLMEDSKIYKAGALAMHLVPGAAALEVPFAFIPVASLSYLAYAGTPLLFQKARKAVKSVWGRLKGKAKVKHAHASLEPVFDAIQEHRGDEYFTSLLFAAFDLTHDWRRAVEVATEAMNEKEN